MTPHFKPLDFFANTVRLKEIIFVLARRGFGELIEGIGLPTSWIKPIIKEERSGQTIWQRIRLTLEDLGPTFVKFGQVLSTRPDVLPEPLIAELKHLRNRVRALPWEDMQRVLTNELSAAPSEVFSAFGETPAASGSIGQVYRATLRGTGSEVAVKIQRPGIRKAIRSDIDIIRWFARQLHEKFDDLKPYDLPEVVQATGEGILQELDFTIEADNADLFNSINHAPDEVFAPHVYHEFTTTRLTVTEWVTGVFPGDVSVPEVIRREAAVKGGRSVFNQIFLAGYFHGDPHGGNIMITPDGRACFIDWGLAGQLTREMRYNLADLFSAVASGDAEKVVRVAVLMSDGTRRIDRVKLEKDIALVLRRFHPEFQRGEKFGEVVMQLIYIFGSNGIRVARDYSLLAKAVISIEEVGYTLDPHFDMRAVGQPILKKLNYERWNPRSMLRQFLWNARNNLHRLRELPQDLQRFFRHLEDGEIKINMRHEGVEKAGEEFSSGVNRLSLAILTGCLIIGSSFVLASTVDKDTTLPQLFKVPALFGSVGFILSGVFGIITIIDIVRHGKHK